MHCEKKGILSSKTWQEPKTVIFMQLKATHKLSTDYSLCWLIIAASYTMHLIYLLKINGASYPIFTQPVQFLTAISTVYTVNSRFLYSQSWKIEDLLYGNDQTSAQPWFISELGHKNSNIVSMMYKDICLAYLITLWSYCIGRYICAVDFNVLPTYALIIGISEIGLRK